MACVPLCHALLLGKFHVSSGHALILGAGILLVMIPFVTSFEWNDSGFKVGMKESAGKLAIKVNENARDALDIRNDMVELSKAMEAIDLKLKEITDNDDPVDSEGDSKEKYSGFGKYYQPGFFDKFQMSNEEWAVNQRNSIAEIEMLEKSIQQIPVK